MQHENRTALDPYLGQYIECTALIGPRRMKNLFGRTRLVLEDVRLHGESIADHTWIMDNDDVEMFALYAQGKRVRFVAQVRRYQRVGYKAHEWQYGLHNVLSVKRKKTTREKHKKQKGMVVAHGHV